jgi:hypothetical protein
MEKFFYEVRPLMYISAALWSYIKLGESHVAAASAIILLFSGVLILHRRFEYRRDAIK